jgi:hypothetical protein
MQIYADNTFIFSDSLGLKLENIEYKDKWYISANRGSPQNFADNQGKRTEIRAKRQLVFLGVRIFAEKNLQKGRNPISSPTI